MPDIGFWELFLIAVVALVVVGPERLPKLVRVTGLWLGRANASIQSIRTEISRELRAEELKQALNKTVDLDAEFSIGSEEAIDFEAPLIEEEDASMGSDSIDSAPANSQSKKSLSEESIESDPIENEEKNSDGNR